MRRTLVDVSPAAGGARRARRGTFRAQIAVARPPRSTARSHSSSHALRLRLPSRRPRPRQPVRSWLFGEGARSIVVALVRHRLRRTRGTAPPRVCAGLAAAARALGGAVWAWGSGRASSRAFFSRRCASAGRGRARPASSAWWSRRCCSRRRRPPRALATRGCLPVCAGTSRGVCACSSGCRTRVLAPPAAPLSAGGASAIPRMDLSDLVSPPAAQPPPARREMRTSARGGDADGDRRARRRDQADRRRGARGRCPGCTTALALLMRATAGR